MKLLIDSDGFCKLGVCGLLQDAVGVFGCTLDECGRLPALPRMLRKGRLRQVYGPDSCDTLLALTEAVPVFSTPLNDWLERLAGIPSIDPGEVQIFATAAEKRLFVLTGDKRALLALKDVPMLPAELSRRIATLEAVLLALCHQLGASILHRRLAPLAAYDTMTRICLSSGEAELCSALRSYYRDLVKEVNPLELWDPGAGGRT